MMKESVRSPCDCSCHFVATTEQQHTGRPASSLHLRNSSKESEKTWKTPSTMKLHLAQIVFVLLLIGGIDCHPHIASNNRLPAEFSNHHPRHQQIHDDPAFRVFYGTGVSLTQFNFNLYRQLAVLIKYQSIKVTLCN